MFKYVQSLQDLDRDWRLIRIHSLRLGVGTGGQGILLRFNNLDLIGQRLLGAHLAFGIPGQHNLGLDSKDSLPKENVSAGSINIIVHGISGVNHETVHEFHGLGSLSPQHTGHNNLASFNS